MYISIQIKNHELTKFVKLKIKIKQFSFSNMLLKIYDSETFYWIF